MLNVWFKLVNINYKFKFSNIMYKFLYEMYREGKYKSLFLSTVETVLNGIGLSGMWTHQFDYTSFARSVYPTVVLGN